MSIAITKGGISVDFNVSKRHIVSTEVSDWQGKVLIIIVMLLSLLAWYFYYKQGLTLAYNDARSHLNVARRVFDNLQPGFAQIGSVWLPLFHVLELPFVWNNFLWRSGLSGSLISMASFILGGVFLIKLTKLIKFDRYGVIISLLIYSLNPNLLFMQTTPMTESLLIFLSIATIYFIVKWVRTYSYLDLICAAFLTFLSSLTRYDGWFLLAFVTLVIGIVAIKKKGYKFTEGNIVFYLTLAGLGVILWFLWNWLIFGDPLFFALGPFSAKSQQDVLFNEGRLLTKGNVIYSFFIYLIASVYNIGSWISLLMVVGIWYLVTSKKYLWQEKLAMSLLLVPFIFNVFSLIAGHSVIHLPGIPPYTWFNDRYGLMMLPLAAIAVGKLANKKRVAAMILGLIIFIQAISMYAGNNIITIEDGVRGASGTYLDEASGWMGKNVDNGLILVAASSNDALLFKSGLNLKQFITEGARGYWDESIVDPTTHAKWVIMHNGDLVEKQLRNNEIFLTNYKLVYRDSFTYIYKLAPGSERITLDQLPS